MFALVGRKLGMAQVFSEDGKLIPVTYVACTPNSVFDIKTDERDGYSAIVLGFENLEEKATKTKKFRVMKEFRGDVSSVEKGGEVNVSIFEEEEKISVTGVSKGKGFQGRVRRHNARVSRRTHGTKYGRHGATGSICITARSQKGLKMAGRMGNETTTLHKREIVRVDSARNIIAIKGSIPGAVRGLVFLKKSS